MFFKMLFSVNSEVQILFQCSGSALIRVDLSRLYPNLDPQCLYRYGSGPKVWIWSHEHFFIVQVPKS
jgi:hypothetical protein